MANTIELAKSYVPLLDEVYQEASVTSVLDGNAELVRAGANAGEMVIPKLKMDGLANYDRSSGYVPGDVELTWETVKADYDRGRSFQVDSQDDAETAGVAFGRLAGEFIRTKVAPEVDAHRLATYAGKATQEFKKEETLADGKAALAAISDAMAAMDNAEVPQDGRYLYINPTLMRAIDDVQTIESKKVLDSFAGIHKVPKGRFYTAIKLNSGKEAESAGGFAKAEGASEINFMIIHKGAVIQFPKHEAPKIIPPEMNQDADAWKYGYRFLGVADVYENKQAGIYLSHQPAGE